jgi:hypothetical protein
MSMNIKYDTTSPSCLVWLKGRRAGVVAGTKKAKGYWEVQVCGKKLRVHRLIWEMHNGPIPEGYVVDHINQDPSDNRLENLRLATLSENNCNARRAEREHPRGVYYTGTCWRGEFWKDGKRYMKKHSSYEVICKWVQEKRLEHHKDFSPAQMYI